MYDPEFTTHQRTLNPIAEFAKPPERVAVSQAVARNLFVAPSSRWDLGLTPYMQEPLDLIVSRAHEAVVFVKPARAGGTKAFVDGLLAYAAVHDPADTLLYFPTERNTKDYFIRELKRSHRDSPALKAALSERAYDNLTDHTIYANGMIASLLWPSSGNVAQRTARFVVLSDYDSMVQDVDGALFDSAKKRVQTAMSAGMVIVESNPKSIVPRRHFNPKYPHEAPYVDGGILPLYNRGDRRRWYWRCLHCDEFFMCPALPDYDKDDSIEAAVKTVRVVCPHCGGIHLSAEKRKLNLGGKWVGETESTIASFWLVGCGAAYQSWESLAREQMRGEREYRETGSETKLRNTANGDQGVAYLPKNIKVTQDPTYLDARKETGVERYHVPPGVRVLLGTADVQGDRFEVAVWGYGPGRERWLVDRFAIRDIQPAIYLEHWDALVDRVLNSTYRLPDHMELRVHKLAVDSAGYANKGGKIQVTSRAYEWWRGLRKKKLAHRALLVKGGSARNAPLVKLTRPSKGDGVPILVLDGNALKDAAALDLQKDAVGPGYVHLPGWLSKEHMAELASEKREANGWVRIDKANETWDLLVYADALWYHLKGNHINWDHPPPWAAKMDGNAEVITRNQRKALKKAPIIGAKRAGLIG